MKARLSFFLLSFVGVAVAIPNKQAFYGTGNNRQVVLQGQVFDVPSDTHPGFSLDLEELRLVQLSEGQEPVWMTELEKVELHHMFHFLSHRSLRFRLKPRDSTSSTCTHSLSFFQLECRFSILLFCVAQKAVTLARLFTCVRRRNVSIPTSWLWGLWNLLSVASYPPLSAHAQVTKVIKTLSTEGPKANLEKFSGFRTRCMSSGLCRHID